MITLANEVAAQDWLASLPEWNARAAERIEKLIALLTAENLHQNLVSAASLNHVWQRHIADAAQLLDIGGRDAGGAWLDLGTGAGFPGMVIAVLQPLRSVYLVESRRKRIVWLERLVSELDLHNVTIHGTRLEAVRDFAAGVISARAFAPLPRLLELSARFSTPETVWLLPKGRSAEQELRQSRVRNGMFHVKHSLTDPDAGILIGHGEP